MNPEVISIIMVIFQMLVCCFGIAMAIGRTRKMQDSIVMIFFIYGTICLLLSDSYWLVHILMRKQARIPFAVNEIGEMGIDLLYVSMVNAVFREKKGRIGLRVVLAAVYSAAMIALWIGWTGEWVKDILSGFTFGYAICVGIKTLGYTRAFGKKDWILLGVASYVLIALQGSIFALPAKIGHVVDIGCYCLMFAVCIWFLAISARAVRTAYVQRTGDTARNAFVLSFIGFLWSRNTMYMSSEPMYYFAQIMCSLMIFTLIWSVLAVTSEQSVREMP